MKVTQNVNRLQAQLAYMIALEVAIEQKLEELIPEVSAMLELQLYSQAFKL